METYEAERLVSENLIQLEEDFNKLGIGQEKPAAKLPIDSEPIDDSPIYFRYLYQLMHKKYAKKLTLFLLLVCVSYSVH